MLKKIVKLTEKDLTTIIKKVVKESKVKRRINEGYGNIEDLQYEFVGILEDLNNFISKAENVIDKYGVESEDAAMLDGYIRDAYRFLKNIDYR